MATSTRSRSHSWSNVAFLFSRAWISLHRKSILYHMTIGSIAGIYFQNTPNVCSIIANLLATVMSTQSFFLATSKNGSDCQKRDQKSFLDVIFNYIILAFQIWFFMNIVLAHPSFFVGITTQPRSPQVEDKRSIKNPYSNNKICIWCSFSLSLIHLTNRINFFEFTSTQIRAKILMKIKMSRWKKYQKTYLILSIIHL